MWRIAEWRFVRRVCLRNPFPLFLFGIPSIHSPARSRFLRAAVRSALLCIMVASCPSLCCSGSKKMCLMQRSRGFGRRVFFSKICYSTVIVFSVVLCDCCKPMNNCWDWAFSSATVGWKCGCQPFSCLCLKHVTHSRKEIYATWESIPAILFGNFKHPLPARSRFLRAAVRSSRSALCLHHAHAFVAAEGKPLSQAEKQRKLSQSCGLQDLLQYSDCALSRAIWLLQTNEQLLRLSF